MKPKNHQIPVTGPASNPVVFGVAQGLKDLFPPVELEPPVSQDAEPSQEVTMVAANSNEEEAA